MDKKKIIQIAVIVLAFGGSGFVLYNGMFKSKPSSIVPAAVSGTGIGQSAPVQILPYGSELNFSVLSKQKQQYGAVSFPQINTSTDISIPVTDLVRTAASTTP